jgi:hypothetical protein
MPTCNEIIDGQLATVMAIRRAVSGTRLDAAASEAALDFLAGLGATLSVHPDVGYKVYEASREIRVKAAAAAAGLADTIARDIAACSRPRAMQASPSGVPAAPSRETVRVGAAE